MKVSKSNAIVTAFETWRCQRKEKMQGYAGEEAPSRGRDPVPEPARFLIRCGVEEGVGEGPECKARAQKGKGSRDV